MAAIVITPRPGIELVSTRWNYALMQKNDSLAQARLAAALAVAATGSPAGAARQLRVDITTIYRRIEALERAAGTRLFVRRARGWSLVAEATAIFEVARRGQHLLDEALEAIQTSGRDKSGRLRVAASEDLATHYLAPRLATFFAAFGRIEVEIMVSPRFADLGGGEADVAIRPHHEPGNTLFGRKVGTMRHALYAAPAYLTRHGHPQSLGDLAGHAVCGFCGDLSDYSIARLINDSVPRSSMPARFSSTAALARAAIEGLGLAALPCFVGDAEPRLQRVTEVDAGVPVEIWLVTTADNRARPPVRAFMRFFSAAIRADYALLGGNPDPP